MGIAALLRPVPGVVARADTAGMVDVRIVELSSRHGRVDAIADELVATATTGITLSPDVLDRLTQADRAAFAWLECHAVPEGWKLIEADRVIVLDRAA